MLKTSLWIIAFILCLGSLTANQASAQAGFGSCKTRLGGASVEFVHDRLVKFEHGSRKQTYKARFLFYALARDWLVAESGLLRNLIIRLQQQSGNNASCRPFQRLIDLLANVSNKDPDPILSDEQLQCFETDLLNLFADSALSRERLELRNNFLPQMSDFEQKLTEGEDLSTDDITRIRDYLQERARFPAQGISGRRDSLVDRVFGACNDFRLLRVVGLFPSPESPDFEEQRRHHREFCGLFIGSINGDHWREASAMIKPLTGITRYGEPKLTEVHTALAVGGVLSYRSIQRPTRFDPAEVTNLYFRILAMQGISQPESRTGAALRDGLISESSIYAFAKSALHVFFGEEVYEQDDVNGRMTGRGLHSHSSIILHWRNSIVNGTAITFRYMRSREELEMYRPEEQTFLIYTPPTDLPSASRVSVFIVYDQVEQRYTFAKTLFPANWINYGKAVVNCMIAFERIPARARSHRVEFEGVKVLVSQNNGLLTSCYPVLPSPQQIDIDALNRNLTATER